MCLLVCVLVFVYSMIIIVYFLLMTLGFICSLLLSCKLGCLKFSFFNYFLRKANIAMNFFLRTPFAVSCRFCMVVFSFSFASVV